MMVIPVPKAFDFHNTITSHGWFALCPYSYDVAARTLYRIQTLPNGQIVQLRWRYVDDGIQLQLSTSGVLSADLEDYLTRLTRRIFCIDWDLKPFYEAMSAYPHYTWIAEKKAGRMLISPTVWEDLVKILLTTNTTWSQTISMVARLCQLGSTAETGLRAFPTPQEIAAIPPDVLQNRVRAGYRSIYLHELAIQIVQDQLDVESWYQSDWKSEALYKAIIGLKGFGDYAAATMLRLLGRFDRIAIDTACRSAYARYYNDGHQADDKTIRAYYEQFGQWRGLAMWMDVMRD